MTIGEGSLGRRPVVLSPEGDLDVASAAEAHKRLLRLDLRRGDQLLLDLRRVTFLDSTGVRLILQAREHAERNGAGFVVGRGPDNVMRVLQLVGLAEQLDMV